MRINRYVAAASGLSRRAADAAVAQGRVQVNGYAAQTGQDVTANDTVTLDGTAIHAPAYHQTILLNKPTGYVVSREGQGSRTIYDILPPELHHLKPVGRLDKESSGLLLLTTDGQLAQTLTHPKYQKTKHYEVTLNKPLAPDAFAQLKEGVQLEDGASHLTVQLVPEVTNQYTVAMHEGRNRQIRRTFDALDYSVVRLHRTQFGDYTLGTLPPGHWKNA
jgi:23S rRNA pseudouridine2605 synthase